MDRVWHLVMIGIVWLVASTVWDYLKERSSKTSAGGGVNSNPKSSPRNPLEIPDEPFFGYSANFRSKDWGKPSPYRYLNGNTDDDLVYLLANEDLGIIKVGIGRLGRIRQYFLSSDSWIQIGCFSFSDKSDARLAERAVLRFWRHECSKASPNVYLGSAPMLTSTGKTEIRSLRGETETVEIDVICEHCTVEVIRKSSGCLGSFNSQLRSRDARNVTCRAGSMGDQRIQNALEWVHLGGVTKSISIKAYTSIDEMIDANIRKEGSGSNRCWIWTSSTNSGYAYVMWDGKPVRVHRFIYKRENPDIGNRILINSCGNRSCVNSAHWDALVENNEKTCITPDCLSPVLKKDLCSACSQRQKRRREYYEDGTSRCISRYCYRSVSKLSKHGYCPTCRKQIISTNKNLD